MQVEGRGGAVGWPPTVIRGDAERPGWASREGGPCWSFLCLEAFPGLTLTKSKPRRLCRTQRAWREPLVAAGIGRPDLRDRSLPDPICVQ